MKNDLELAYVGIGSRDRAAMDGYLERAIGLMRGAAAVENCSAWRMDERVYRLLVEDSEQDDALYLGFEAQSQACFDATRQRLQAQGVTLTPGTAAQKASRQVRELVSMQAPWGVRVELVSGLAHADTAFTSILQPRAFVTRGRGMGHAVFTAGDQATYDATRRFCVDGLGMVLSDWLEGSAGPMPLHVSFFHCNARHHSLAFAHLPIGAVPQKLHHVNLQVPDMDAVGLSFDRCLQAGTPMANLLGRHGNDQMFSFYSHTPGGWQIEVGAGGAEITESWNAVVKWDRISDWGHQPPAALATAVEPPPA
jgi:2,3-dihydroxybiphenyl 1,2-dioxygenase